MPEFIFKYTRFCRYLSLLFFILYSANLFFAQNASAEFEQKLSPSELKEDLKILRKSLEELHIGLYTYTSAEKFELKFREIESTLDKSQTPLKFFREISHLNKLIGNGHTSFVPPKSFRDDLKTKLPRFPFEVYWDRGSLYILKNLSADNSIEEGSVIKSINGELTEKVFAEMVNKIKRDGYNMSHPISRLSRDFSVYFAYLKGTPDSFQFELKEPDGKIRNVSLKGLPFGEIEQNRLARYKARKITWEETQDPALKLSMDGKIATLKVRTFQKKLIKKKGQNWKKFLKKSFKKIRKAGVEHLILDLRDNNGGQPQLTIDLFAYLQSKPFTFYRSINARVGKIPRKPHFVKDGSIENFESVGWEKNGDFFEPKDKSVFKKHDPVKKPFRGKVYILINAFSTSATGTFAGMLKSIDRGIFIGNEAGGNPFQTVARQAVRVELPNSKITLVLPLVLSIKNVTFENTGRGVIPKHQIIPTFEDVANKRDVVKEFTLKLINKD